jgi:hypothetical protein
MRSAEHRLEEVGALRESAREGRIEYEIFPVLTFEALAMDWFEVVLHAEAEGKELPDLEELAAFLTRRVRANGSCEVSVSPCYFTARPPGAGQPISATRLLRSISVVVENIAPYAKGSEPPLLVQLRNDLEQLGIAPVEVVRSTK